MNKIKGIVFDIQRFCVDDGPGIRTAVFLKGCNMRCFWCHNPESLSSQTELRYLPAKCLGCGRCAAVCPTHAHRMDGGLHAYDRERCTACGRCAEACPAGALLMAGETMDATDVMSVVRRDLPFYRNSGGGATFTGGEPLLQADFLAELLRLCRLEGIHTAVETALNVPWPSVEAAAPLVDLFLADIKLIDDRRHREATGAGNGRILENFTRLSAAGRPIVVRIPVIPGVNDNQEDMEDIAGFVLKLKSCTGVQLMPFHNMAKEKYASLGLPYRCDGMASLPRERLADLSEPFRRLGIAVL